MLFVAFIMAIAIVIYAVLIGLFVGTTGAMAYIACIIAILVIIYHLD